MAWEDDRWWWEEAGVLIGGDGRKWWYFGSRGWACMAPDWLQWLPVFSIRYPDKVGHAVVHFVLTWGFLRFLPDVRWVAYAVPPAYGMWYELRGWRWGLASWRDLVANTVGWGLALLLRT